MAKTKILTEEIRYEDILSLIIIIVEAKIVNGLIYFSKQSSENFISIVMKMENLINKKAKFI